MQAMRQTTKMAAILGILLSLCAICRSASAQSPDTAVVPSLVEVYWKSSRTIVLPGISNVIVLDEEITRAETGTDFLRFYGLERGETIVLGYVNGKPISMRVRVIDRPQVPVSPSLLRRQSEMAQGRVSSTAQIANGGGTTSVALLHGFSWSQPVGGDSRLEVSSQLEDNSFANGHAFNVRRATVLYHSPVMDVRALDFDVDLTGAGSQRYLGPFSFFDSIELRGVKVNWKRGENQYTFFGGTTIPYFYLTLGSTRDAAGFTFQRKQTDKLALFAASTWINAPLDFLGLTSERRNNAMQTAGLTYLLNARWAMQAIGGASNHGGLARGQLTYTGQRVSAFFAGNTSSPMFPLNQIESLFSGTSSLKAGWTLRNTDWLTESVYYQHTATKETGGIIHGGSSDYLSPGLWFKLIKGQDVNFTYTYSRNNGGFSTASSTGHRFDTNWHSQLRHRISNSAQFTVGSLQDPLQLSSEDQFQFRDAVAFPVKGGSMFVAFEHDRTDPSLVRKLNAELNLLTPALQALFLRDPVSFVDSSNLPLDIRAILAAQHPINTAVSTSGQFRLGTKLTFNPSLSLGKFTTGRTESWTPFFGYGLVYQLRPSLQFVSSMTNVWVLASSQNLVQRTTLVSFGFTWTFNAAPSLLVPGHHGRVIEGRVFRDNNVNGVFNAGEPGFAGILVQLENGDSVLTDSGGRYKFTGVDAGEHQVLLRLAQFREPIRMTTRSQVDVDLIRDRSAVVNFGIINFARVMGNVFNDLRFEGKRQLDSKGLPEIHLILDDGKQKRTIVTEGTGDYQVDDVSPGDYTLTVDTSTVPANYVVPNDTFLVHVGPVSTVLQDVPVRALRSISGKVLLRVRLDSTVPLPGRSQRGGQADGKAGQAGGVGNGNDYTLVPMADVQITAGYGIAKTDENGSFLLRNLPAGDLTISLVPVKPLPEGMKVPSGTVHMPPDPVQVEGATIVISNPDLVPYLVDKSAQEVRDSAFRARLRNGAPSQGTKTYSPAQPAGQKR